MELIIKNKSFNSNKFKSFNEFVLNLKVNNIEWKELEGNDANNFWLIMEDIRCYMLDNLKKFNMTWKDFKDYASEWFEEYKPNEENKENKYVMVWKDE